MTDIVVGEIIEVSPDGDIVIRAKIDMGAYVTKNFKLVTIYLQDDRTISDKQRKFCYSLIAAIADVQGEKVKKVDREMMKEFLKLRFIVENLDPLAQHLFSLSNVPMDIIAEFQKDLIDIVLEYDIPTKFSLLEYIDENSISDYVYACLIHKKCCICGRPADLHHCIRVGMGNNRDEIIHEGLEVLPLCREHHQEVHSTGDTDFYKLYHLDGGITCDKTIVKIYHLKSKRGGKA